MKRDKHQQQLDDFASLPLALGKFLVRPLLPCTVSSVVTEWKKSIMRRITKGLEQMVVIMKQSIAQ